MALKIIFMYLVSFGKPVGSQGSQIINGFNIQIRFNRLIVVKKVSVSLFVVHQIALAECRAI